MVGGFIVFYATRLSPSGAGAGAVPFWLAGSVIVK